MTTKVTDLFPRLRRRRRHMREVFRHRPEVRCERAGSQAEFYRRAR